MAGQVVSLDEASALWEKCGGQAPPRKASPEVVCVVIPVFGRPVPVCYAPFQLGPLA
jgi:hypothetical protein